MLSMEIQKPKENIVSVLRLLVSMPNVLAIFAWFEKKKSYTRACCLDLNVAEGHPEALSHLGNVA